MPRAGSNARTEGNPKMRQTENPTPASAALDYDSTMIGALELSAWFWLRFQPDSALAKWFRERVGQATRAHVQGHDRCARAQASHSAVALRQGRRYSGGSDDEDSVRRFRRRSVSGSRPAVAVDCPGPLKRGRRSTEWRRRAELLARIAGSWFGIATSHRIRGWQGALPRQTGVRPRSETQSDFDA